MRAVKKIFNIAYIFVCILLLAGLFWGIKFIVDLGKGFNDSKLNSYGKIEQKQDNKSESSYLESSAVEQRGIKTKKLPTDATSFKIEVPYGDVSINSTDKEPYMTYNTKRDIDVNKTNRDGLCEISISGNLKFKDSLKINWGKDVKIDIYLPKDKLQKMRVEFSAGLLRINDIKADKFDIDMSAGKAVIKNCEFDNVKASLSAGDFELYAYPNVKSIDCDVSAGNMNLFIPKNIKGFDIDFETSLGQLTNNLSFNMQGSDEHNLIGKEGRFTYGDKSCVMNFDVSVGNITLDDYNLE